jgi:hypothetical protein
MTLPATDQTSDIARRLARFRSARSDPGGPHGDLPYRPISSADLAERLAATLDGQVVDGPAGRFVRIEGEAVEISIDRDRLARLPGYPEPDRPLVCLDTETTGLATAAGTVAFCIGLGWWEGSMFRQVQLILPDHGDEPAMLDELARLIPADAWLVTYNGRGFDWPLLVARYRLHRRGAPVHDGHLDLLPTVRRIFRHRMTDARLQTAETTLLGMTRHDDVDGWEIPARYLGFLRGGPPHPLLAVVRHNDEDVRSLARILALLDTNYATEGARRTVPAGDLAGLARAFVRVRRLDEALGCLDEAVSRIEPAGARSPITEEPDPAGMDMARMPAPRIAPGPVEPWWSPRAVADFGGPTRRVGPARSWPGRAAFDRPWDGPRVAADRAHLLRRLGRYGESAEAWGQLATGSGRIAVVASIETAKLHEHRLHDRSGALTAALHGLAVVDRRRRLGLPEPRLEDDLRRRIARLRRRSSVRDGHDRHLAAELARDESPNALAGRASANGREGRHARQPDILDRERARRGRKPEIGADPATQHAD